ncbi:MAG TPA: hypothetical protein PK791_01150, partial [Anaerolineaceae bacterium]|nr:hypothetical protein [Anaerolineaceae bacterium]
GTMTTGAAAKKLGRDYIMIEMDKKYCDYGEVRLASVVYEESPISKAIFDEKPIKVTVPEMIEAEALFEGETFYLRNGEAIATLCSDGKLNYQDKKIDMHTLAAIARNVKAKRLNGFDYWYVKRDEKLISISHIREDYRIKKGQIWVQPSIF